MLCKPLGSEVSAGAPVEQVTDAVDGTQPVRSTMGNGQKMIHTDTSLLLTLCLSQGRPQGFCVVTSGQVVLCKPLGSQRSGNTIRPFSGDVAPSCPRYLIVAPHRQAPLSCLMNSSALG